MTLTEALAEWRQLRDAGDTSPYIVTDTVFVGLAQWADLVTALRMPHRFWRGYRAPPPVCAACPCCGATVRVLPSGRWRAHVVTPTAAEQAHLPRLTGGRRWILGRCPESRRTRR